MDSSEKSQKSIIRKMNSDGSADSPDIFDNNLFGVLDIDETHSSDSEEEEEEEEEEEDDNDEDDDGFEDENDNSKNISGIYSVESIGPPAGVLSTPTSKSDSPDMAHSSILDLHEVNFNDQVKFMDMNIQALNEEGKENIVKEQFTCDLAGYNLCFNAAGCWDHFKECSCWQEYQLIP